MFSQRLLSGLLMLIVSLVCSLPIGPAAANETTIGPPQVFARVMKIQADLELIRNKMGKPQAGSPMLHISKAAPREVFFQALTLFQKANRLSCEQTRKRGKTPKTPQGNIRPSNVLAVVNAAWDRLRRVQTSLGIDTPSPDIAPDASKTPTDVFNAIVQTNRQLNLVLDQEFTPSHVLQQVATAVEYTAQLIRQFPKATARPSPPEFQPKKRPADVFNRLIHCTGQVQQIMRASGLAMLTLKTHNAQNVKVTPSDVYDVATLLVAELAHLQRQLLNATEPPKVYRRQQRTFPAHVYQHAGVLEMQLHTLRALVDQRPAWLRTAATQ